MTERRRVTAPPEPAGEPLHIKYRPKKLVDVVGQDSVVKSIESAIKSKTRQHTYFLFGPGGTGKTTLARIMAAEFGCGDVTEVDAASNTGIDDMRRVMEAVRYQSFGDEPGRAYVIDECHRLSANAWDSLLKITEEPPAHVFFFFASTNPAKIPDAMLTRGPQYVLKPLRYNDIVGVLEDVIASEGFECTDAVMDEVAEACGGSLRQALVMLAQVADVQDTNEARDLLGGIAETPAVIDLCRALLGNPSWNEVQSMLKGMEELGAEGIRIQVTLYFAKVAMSAKARDAGRALDILRVFSKPCNPTDKLAPILLMLDEAIG